MVVEGGSNNAWWWWWTTIIDKEVAILEFYIDAMVKSANKLRYVDSKNTHGYSLLGLVDSTKTDPRL